MIDKLVNVSSRLTLARRIAVYGNRGDAGSRYSLIDITAYVPSLLDINKLIYILHVLFFNQIRAKKHTSQPGRHWLHWYFYIYF